MTPFLTIDTETTGTDFYKGSIPFAVSACDYKGRLWYWQWPVDPFTRKVSVSKRDVQSIAELIANYPLLVMHNAKFDVTALDAIDLGGDMLLPERLKHGKIEDTLLMSHVLCSSDDHGLKSLGKKYLDIPTTDEDNLKKEVAKARNIGRKQGWKLGIDCQGRSQSKWDYWMVPLALGTPTVKTYSTSDAIRTAKLFQFYLTLFGHSGAGRFSDDPAWECYLREKRLAYVVYKMESVGVRLDAAQLSQELSNRRVEVDKLSKAVSRFAAGYGFKNFNLQSDIQLGALLDKLKFPVFRTTKKTGRRGTSADDLQQLSELKKTTPPQKEFLSKVTAHNKTATGLGYLTEYRDRSDLEEVSHSMDGKKSKFLRYPVLRSHFNQTGTDTTRFSSSGPNLQNVAEQDEEGMNLRAVFAPRPGYFWWDLDYSNLELRIFAVMANEQSLLDAFARGEEAHLVIANELHGDTFGPNYKEDPRYKCTKNGNFSLIYGAGEARADATYGVDGAYRIIRDRFPGIDAFMDLSIKEAREDGYITTLGGYKLYVPPDRPYAAVNYKVQGTAGDILKNAMVSIDDQLTVFNATKERKNKPPVQLLMTVHDELVYEVPNELATCGGLNHPNRLPVNSDPILGFELFQMLVSTMREAGADLGVDTPAKASLVTRRWSEKVPIDSMTGKPFPRKGKVRV